MPTRFASRIRKGLSAQVLLGLVACSLPSAMAAAAVPKLTTLEGVLLGAGGGPAVDGTYDVNFALYPAASGAAAFWSEGPIKVPVVNGRFAAALGGVKPLDVAAIAAAPAAWLGVQVGVDPELPRVVLRASPFALLAASAEGLSCSGCVGGNQLTDGSIAAAKVGFNFAGAATKGGPALDLACTGCVGVAELIFDGDVDLGGQSIKAKNGTFGGDLVAKNVTAQSFVGDGSKLTGIKSVAGTCSKPGEVMKGIANDGSIVCVPGIDASALPKDALDDVSNGLLTNQYVDKVAAPQKGVKIPDNTGADANSTIEFPDLGIAQTIEIAVEIANTDLSVVSAVLLPADDKKTGWVLCDPCGKKDEKSFKAVLSPSNKPVSGDIGAWIGQNPKGTWTLKVKDTGFCLPQVVGNEALCDAPNKTDGSIVDWSIQIQTVSSKKVSALGAFQVAVTDTPPVPCTVAHMGVLYLAPTTKSLMVCNGKEYFPLYLATVGTQDNPAASCKEVLTKHPGSKDGLYWINAGGGPAYQASCNMTDNGGGWTLAARMVSGSHCHINENKVGTLTAANQSGCAKLSDAAIRALYTNQFWVGCGAASPSRFGTIDNISKFNTISATGDKKMTWSETNGGQTYTGTDHACCNFGDHDYHSPHIIYSIAKGYNGGNYTADWSGCYNSLHGWHQSGFLWVR